MNEAVHVRIAEALARIAAVARAREGRAAQRNALSALQARALRELRRRPGLRVGELAAALLVTAGTLSAALSVLVRKGLVRKEADAAEHRALRLSLTRKGGAAAERAGRWGAELLEPIVAELPAGEAGALLESLLTLIRGFERRGMVPTGRMCVSCRYFRPGAGQGDRPHHCGLLEAPIGRHELQVDCPDHEPAGVAT